MENIDIYEINEAFGSQAVYCVEKLGIPMHKVNPKGGALALGHPLGCTGARQVATLLHELKRRGQRLVMREGIISGKKGKLLKQAIFIYWAVFIRYTRSRMQQLASVIFTYGVVYVVMLGTQSELLPGFHLYVHG